MLNSKTRKAGMFIVLLCLVIALTVPSTAFLGTDYLFDRESGPPKTDWYEVADWEVKFCMAWGGTDKVITSGVGTMDHEASLITNNRIFTIQAEKAEIVPSQVPEGQDIEGIVVYEVAWYVMPFEFDDDANYEVYLVDETGFSRVLDSGNANYYNPAKGYATNESEKNFTEARLKVWNEDFDKILTVPIV